MMMSSSSSLQVVTLDDGTHDDAPHLPSTVPQQEKKQPQEQHQQSTTTNTPSSSRGRMLVTPPSSRSIATGSAAFLPQNNYSKCACDDAHHAQHSTCVDNNNNNKTKSAEEDDGRVISSSCRSSSSENDDDDNDNDPLKSLHPPPTCMENARDALLRFLDHAFFQYLGMAVLMGVVVSGAVFFFFLMGWQTLCKIPSPTNCQPRNDIYNVAIQVLTAFFTYMATLSMPWRSVNFLHTVGWHCPSSRLNTPGHDLYGLSTDDVWFHISPRPRLAILVLLLWNCLFQYANQVSRILFYNYELQDDFPGTLWTNLFFVASMACAAAGGALQAYHVATIRITDPQRFGLGPIDLCKQWWNVHGKEPQTTQSQPQRRRETHDADASFDSYDSSCHSNSGGQQDNTPIDVETQQQQENNYVKSERLIPPLHDDTNGFDVTATGRPYRHISSAPAVLISTAPTVTTANADVDASYNTTDDSPQHRHHHHHHHGQHHPQHHHQYHDPTRSEDPPLTGEQNRGAMRMWAM